MTKGELLDILEKYPDECEIVVESLENCCDYEIAEIRAEYIEANDFGIPNLVIAHRIKER